MTTRASLARVTARLAIGLLLLVAMTSCSRAPEGIEGTWRVALTLPGGELPFGLAFTRKDDNLGATILNGEERIEVAEATQSGNELTLLMPGFQHRIDAHVEGGEIRGTLTLVKRGGELQKIPLRAKRSEELSFFTQEALTGTEPVTVSGRWSVRFTNDDGSITDAVGEFRQQGAHVNGTFLTGTGDHRYLSGQVKGNELYLGKFDGAQAYLYRARVQPKGFSGDYWSGLKSHDTMVARFDSDANLGTSEQATTLRSQDEHFDFTFPDLEGRKVSLHDPDFAGKVVIVALAGSWCPNCHDEAGFLSPYYKQHHAQGLEVVSLMFEQFDGYDEAVAAIKRFQQKFAIDYTVLVAGVNDKEDAATRLPQLNKVVAFPTTLFIDRKGKVRYIHTGFSGPATGEHYETTKKNLDKIVQDLLAEKA